MTDRMLTGVIDADYYGGRDGLGFETQQVNGVQSAGTAVLSPDPPTKLSSTRDLATF
jgi:hypothetical protein